MQIKAKTPQEIEAMRKGGKILGKILSELAAFTKPGITTRDLENKAEKLFKQYKVEASFKGYRGYPCILCTSVNNEVVHSIPNDTPLKEGDILSIDCGVKYQNLNTDSAIAIIVGDKADPETETFLNTCIKALWKGIEQVKPGNTTGDIGHAIQSFVEASGYSIVPDLTGHGIGYTLHEDPYVPNYGKPGTGHKLIPGLTIAIEPIITLGSPEIDTLSDNWTIVTKDDSLAIQHEHTVLVTEDGVEVLTLREGEINK